jgi:hypothetical protein
MADEPDNNDPPQTGGPSQEEVEALKSKNDELVGEVRKLSERLKAFGELTPDEAKEAARKAKEAEEAELTAQGQYEELKKRLQSEHRTEVEKREEVIQSLQGRLQKLLVDDALSKAMDEVGVLPDRKEYVRRYFLAESPVVKDDAGVFERSDGDVPITKAVKEWAESDEADPFVAGALKNGTGSRSGGGAGGSGKGWGEMSATEQAALYKTNPERAKQLAQAAGQDIG